MASRDPKGQNRDLNMLRAQHLENGWRQRLSSKGPQIGNELWGIKWPRHRCHHLTPKSKTRDHNTLRAKTAGDAI